MKLSSLNFTNFKTTSKMMVVYPFAILFGRKNKNTWLISERPDQARDNGYIFFKYICKEQPSQKVIYLIDKKSNDYKKIKDLGKIVQFDSLKHYFLFLCSRIHISAHVGGCNPSNAPICRYIKKRRKYKDVFIPHGVSYGISEFCLKKYSMIDLFICSNKLEYQNVLENYGYSKDEVAYTGFPRLDEWWNKVEVKKQIVVMPTWRVFLRGSTDDEFVKSDYYKNWSSLINNDELMTLLENNNINLIFYLHNDFLKYSHLFKTKSKLIKIVGKDDDVDIQKLLKESSLLITDYSSVHFDFAYMKKPIIYYQFDRELFFDVQYKKSVFMPEINGFGPVYRSFDDLLCYIEVLIKNYFNNGPHYIEKMRSIYYFFDKCNSKRVFDCICKI